MAFLSLWQMTPFFFLLLVSIFRPSHSVSLSLSDIEREERSVDPFVALDTYLKEFYPKYPKPIKPIGELPPFRAPGNIPSFAVINQYFNYVIPAYFKASQICSDLSVYVGVLMNRIRIEKGTEKDVEGLLMNMCVVRQKPQIVCAGLAKRFVPTFHFIVKNRPLLTPEVFVGTVFQQLGCRTNSSYVEWSVNDPFIGLDKNETLIEDSTDGSDGDNETESPNPILTDEVTPPMTDDSVTAATPIVDEIVMPKETAKVNVRQPRNEPTTESMLTHVPRRKPRPTKMTTPENGIEPEKEEDLEETTLEDVEDTTVLVEETTEIPDRTTKRRRTTTTEAPDENVDDTTVPDQEIFEITEKSTKRRRTTTIAAEEDLEFEEITDVPMKSTKRRRSTTTEGEETTTTMFPFPQEESIFSTDATELFEKTTKRRRTTTEAPEDTTILDQEMPEITEKSTKRRRTTTEVPVEAANEEIVTLEPEMTTRRRRTTTTEESTVLTDATTTTESTTTERSTTTEMPTTTTEKTTTTEMPTTTTTEKTTTTEIPTTTTEKSTTTETQTTPPPPPFGEPAFEEPLRPLKILHMTDLHVDPLYLPDTNAACENKMLCCHEDSGKPANRTVSAGFYGSNLYCDTPEATLVSALKSIQQHHGDIDVFYMSGDLVPHNLWYTNKPENIKTIERVSGLIRTYFPTTQIIPIMGNHEPHPVDLFSPKNLSIPSHLSTRWLYPATRRSWMTWIPQEAADEYQQFGHYSIQLNERFRVLVLNTNLCFGFNLWQLYNFNEFKEQLKWLQFQLQKAQEENQFVHILGHLPPGYGGCSRVFSRNYYQIVANYSKIIGGQFYGHLHVDTFRLYYNPQRRVEPINVQWITPSLTPYKSNNPAYKIYYADPSNFQVLDHETYIFDLEKANASPHLEPDWFKTYSASDMYTVPNVTVTNLAFIVDRLAASSQLFELYYQHHLKAADYLQSKKCDTYCRKKILCRMVRPYFGSEEECERLQLKVDGSIVPVYDEYPIF